MSPSPEEPASETGAGGADASLFSVAAGADRGCISVPLTATSLPRGEDAGFALPDESGAASDGESAACIAGSDVAGVATGLLCAGSASEYARSVRGEDLSRAFVDVVRGSRLRNRRHVSELCSGAAVPVVTTDFASNALLVSTSSCPVTASPLRIW